MATKTKYIALLLSIALLAIGCSKVKYDGVPQRILARFSYKPGSYWIFRDSISGRVDSLYVESNRYLNGNPPYQKASVSIYLRQLSIQGGQADDTCYWGLTLYGGSESAPSSVHSSFYRDKYNERYSDYLFRFPFGNYYMSDALANYTAGQYFFPAIVEARFVRKKGDSNYHKVFIAEYDGFVRIEFCSVTRIDASAVFILQRYKVVK